jgi:hypothetical protein
MSWHLIAWPYALAFLALVACATWFVVRLCRNGDAVDDDLPPRRGEAWKTATTRAEDFGVNTLGYRRPTVPPPPPRSSGGGK